MASRGQSLTVTYVAWDTVSNIGKTGDVANHTLRWVKDGTSSAPTNAAAEIDSTNAKGLYKLLLTGTECTCDFGTLGGVSSTSGISIIPVSVSFEQLPTAAPAAANGLPTVGTSAGQINPDGTGSIPIAFGTTVPATPTLGTTGAAMSWASGKIGRVATAQAGTSTTITLDSGASAVDNSYKDHSIKIIGGTGSGQFATIVSYVGSTKIATVFRPSGNWTINPDSTSVFMIELVPAVDLLQVQNFNNTGQTTKNAVTLASTDVTGNIAVDIQTIKGQVVTAAAGVTFPSIIPTAAQNATAAWQDATAGDFTTVGSIGKFVMSQLAGTLVGTTSVFASASLVNTPTSGGTVTLGSGSVSASNSTTIFTASGSGLPLNVNTSIPMSIVFQSGTLSNKFDRFRIRSYVYDTGTSTALIILLDAAPAIPQVGDTFVIG